LLILDTANYQLGVYIGKAVAGVLGGKDVYPRKPELVDKFEREKQETKNPVRWYSRAETEAWLAKRRQEKANNV